MYVYNLPYRRKERAWEKHAGSHSAVPVFLISDFVSLSEKWKMFFQVLIVFLSVNNSLS